MQRSTDEDDLASRLFELVHSSFHSVEGTEDIDVNDGLKSIRGKIFDRGEKVTGSTTAGRSC